MAFMLQLLLLLGIGLLGVKTLDDLKLKYVTVVFRHGDRAPDIHGAEAFPNDPNVEHNFFPVDIGGLTNNGKRREYALGETIRNNYGHFLGDIYSSHEIIARSTDYDRTKMSLQLVLAAIYPPTELQKWNPGLNWQPVVTNYVESSKDVLMIPEECPKYLEEFRRIKRSAEVTEKINNYRNFMENLSKWSGKSIRLPNDMFNLYHALMAESSMGLGIPNWADGIFPRGLLWNGTVLEYEIVSYNKKLKKLNGGVLLKNITDTMLSILIRDDKKKMSLLSGHETNVAALLQTLGVFTPHVPEYSSGIFFELLEGSTGHYVRILYYLGIPSALEEKRIPGCPSPCPLLDFITLLSDVIPSDDDLLCEKPSPKANSHSWRNVASIAELVRLRSKSL